MSSNVRLANEYCSSIGPKPNETKMCEAGPKCPKPTWVKGPYGEVSHVHWFLHHNVFLFVIVSARESVEGVERSIGL